MSVAPAKLPEVKSVYEKNKRSNNIHQIISLLNKNIKNQTTLEKLRESKSEHLFHPIHSEDLCMLSQKELRYYKKNLEIKRGKIQSMANKMVTLTGASQSLTSFQLQKAKMDKDQKKRDTQLKRMTIIQNCPSLAEFYESYLTKNPKKSEQEIEFDGFVNKYPKRFEGFGQFLFMPERRIVHKNSRFVRFDDVDMGDEVEAAIYNDGGRSAPQKLKKYVNQQMDRILNDKMNEKNFKMKSADMHQMSSSSRRKKYQSQSHGTASKIASQSGYKSTLNQNFQNPDNYKNLHNTSNNMTNISGLQNSPHVVTIYSDDEEHLETQQQYQNSKERENEEDNHQEIQNLKSRSQGPSTGAQSKGQSKNHSRQLSQERQTQNIGVQDIKNKETSSKVQSLFKQKLLQKAQLKQNEKVKKRKKNHEDSVLDISLIIEKNKMLLDIGNSKTLKFSTLVKNLHNIKRYQNSVLNLKSPTKSLIENKGSFIKTNSLTELSVMNKYREALDKFQNGLSPMSDMKTEAQTNNKMGSFQKQGNNKIYAFNFSGNYSNNQQQSNGSKHFQQSSTDYTESLIPVVGQIQQILDPKSHDNFLNMIVKNQVRLQTQQAARPQTTTASVINPLGNGNNNNLVMMNLRKQAIVSRGSIKLFPSFQHTNIKSFNNGSNNYNHQNMSNSNYNSDLKHKTVHFNNNNNNSQQFNHEIGNYKHRTLSP
eukprot:403330905